MGDSEKPTSVDAIMEAFLEAQARGEAPDQEALLKEHPEHREQFQARLAALGRVDDCFRMIRESSSQGDGPRVEIPKNLRITGYRILDKIGEGGMSAVFLAEQTALKRLVALKVMSPAWSSDARSIARFKREAETIARLAHPGIVPIHHFGGEDGTHFLVLDLVSGIDLGSLIQGLKGSGVPENGLPVLEIMRGRMDRIGAVAAEHGKRPDDPGADKEFWSRPYPEICATILRDVAAALECAHEKGVIHRDIKPSNIIVSPDGKPRIIDFGLTLPESADALTRSTDFLGTVLYASPEQVSGSAHDVGPQSDLFSLGAVMYELLTLRRPFEGGSLSEVFEKLTRQDPPSMRRQTSQVPPDLETICFVALEKEGKHRYASAKELKDDLQRFLDHRTIRARPTPLMRRLGKLIRRNPVPIAAAALLLAAGGGFWWKLAHTRSTASQASHELAEARSRLEQAREASEQDVRQERYLRIVSEGKALLKEGHSERAQKLFSDAIELAPERPEAYLTRAEASFLSESGLSHALADIRKAEALQTPGRDALTLKAAVLHRLGRNEESIQTEREILRRFPNDREASIRLSYRLMESKEYPEAASLLEERIKSNPDDPELLTAAAWADLGLERVETALARAGKAARIAPSNASVHMALGHALMRSKRYAEAAGAFSLLLKVEPANVKARLLCAEALTLAGELEAGERQFLASLDQGAADARALQGLAGNLVRQGRVEEAVGLYKRSLAAGEGNASTLIMIAELLEIVGRPDEAVDFYERAGKLATSDSDRQHVKEKLDKLLNKP
ncbi:MAG: protein kinase [Elusimicrobiota bacterium]